VPCTNCFSKSLRDYVVEGVCEVMESNILGLDYAETSEDCAAKCMHGPCKYWSWMGSTFTHSKNMCIRLSACPKVMPCETGTCMTGHLLAAEAKDQQTGPRVHYYVSKFLKPCYAPAASALAKDQEEELFKESCQLLMANKKEVFKLCFDDDNTEYMRIEHQGSPLPYPAERSVIIGDEVWSLDCLYEPSCWTYNLVEKTLTRQKLSDKNFTLLKPRLESTPVGVGQSLIQYGGDYDDSYYEIDNDKTPSYEVYDTTTGELTYRRAIYTPTHTLCTVPVSDTEFISIERVLDSSTVIHVFKHNITGDDLISLEDFPPYPITPLSCLYNGTSLYVKEFTRSNTLWVYNMETLSPGWKSITIPQEWKGHSMNRFYEMQTMGMLTHKAGSIRLLLREENQYILGQLSGQTEYSYGEKHYSGPDFSFAEMDYSGPSEFDRLTATFKLP